MAAFLKQTNKRNRNIIIIVFIAACFIIYFSFDSDIPIPNTLEIGLRANGHYYRYVKLLNNAVHKDTAALKNFLDQRYIYDAALYYHGYILFQILEKDGDVMFSQALQKIDSTQVENIRGYIDAGIEHCIEKPNDTLVHNYPKTSGILGIHSQ